jgi:hypothetical protein
MSFLAGEWTYELFRPRLFRVEEPGLISMRSTPESEHAAELKNSALAYAIVGSIASLAMGLAGGFAGRSPGRGAMVGLGAQACGSLVGSVAALALFPLVNRRLVEGTLDFIWPLAINAAVLSAIGAVAGLAFAIGIGRKCVLIDATIAAGIGAFLAAILVRLSEVCLLPESGHVDLVARWSVLRFLGTIIPCSLIGAGAAKGTLKAGRRQ